MIEFNSIPDDLIAPIVAFEVNSAGQYESASRGLILAHATGEGTITANEPVICPTRTEGRLLGGAGSMLSSMVTLLRRNAPAQELWVVAVPEIGTARVVTVTITSDPSGGQAALRIAGETIKVTVASGDAADDVAAAFATAINGYYNRLTGADLPMTASATDDVITLTARHKGVLGNTIGISVPVLDGANVMTGKTTIAQATAGAGTPDTATALASLGDMEFDWIVSPWSDATNVQNYGDLLNSTSGRWSYVDQLYGHVFYPLADTTANIVTHGLAQDEVHVSVLPIIASSNAPQPVWDWAAAMIGRIMPWLSGGATGNVSRNQTGLVVEGLYPPEDRTGWLDYATRQSFLRSGISTWKVDVGGNVVIDKIITTARTTQGVPDSTFRDIQAIAQLTYGLRKLRADLTIAFGTQKAIADDNPGNLGSIVTVSEIKAGYMHSYRELEKQGVFENSTRAAELTEVRRDAVNANRVNIYGPIDRVNPLDILATNVVLNSQFDAA